MAKVVLYGCGVGADTAFRYLSRDSSHVICGFTADAAFVRQRTFHGLPVVDYEAVESSFPPTDYEMFVPLGFQAMNRLRAEKYLDAKQKGYRFISYVHSRQSSLEKIRVGENCFILEAQVFNLDVTIGDNVTIWSGNHIGDRTVIGNHVWISSHVTLAGDVVVGEYSFFGVNSSVSNRVKIARGTFVGAGVLISQDTAENSVFVAPAPRQVHMSSERFLSMLNIT